MCPYYYSLSPTSISYVNIHKKKSSVKKKKIVQMWRHQNFWPEMRIFIEGLTNVDGSRFALDIGRLI